MFGVWGVRVRDGRGRIWKVSVQELLQIWGVGGLGLGLGGGRFRRWEFKIWGTGGLRLGKRHMFQARESRVCESVRVCERERGRVREREWVRVREYV